MSHVEAASNLARPVRFTCRYAMLGTDHQTDSAYVFLVPDEGYSDLSRLHDHLYRGVLAEHLRLDVPFIPHITMGACSDHWLAKRLCDDLNDHGLEVGGLVDTLTVAAVDGGKVRELGAFGLAVGLPMRMNHDRTDPKPEQRGRHTPQRSWEKAKWPISACPMAAGAKHPRQQRHGHVPAQEHGAARGLGQPDHEAPGGVADHVDRLAGESPGDVLQHTLEIIHPRDSRRRRECRWAQPLLKGSGVGMHAGRGPEGRPRTVRVLQFWGVFRHRSSEKCSTSPEISTLGSKPPQKESTYGPIYGFRPCVFCAQDWMPALFVPGRRIRGWRRSQWRSGRVRPARSEDA